MVSKREVWRAVGGAAGYEVSNHGRVRSRWSTGGCPARLVSKWRFISNGTSPRKYRHVVLCGYQKRKTTVHQLVMLMFVGPVPAGHQINHKDGNKSNCKLSNLEYVTPLHNNLHAIRTGLRKASPGKRGETNRIAKFTNKQADEIRRLHVAEKIGRNALARKHGVARSTIGRILSNESYSK